MNVYGYVPLRNAKFYHYFDSSFISLRNKEVIVYKCGRHSPIAKKVVGWSNLPPRLRAQGQLCPDCKKKTPKRGELLHDPK